MQQSRKVWFVRLIRHLLMALAMLAVAALPGPSHGLPKHDGAGVHTDVALHLAADHADALASRQATRASHGDHDHCPGHGHGKGCMTACCATSCLPLAALMSLPAPKWAAVAIAGQIDDADRDGAVVGLPKRPPKTV